jgi:hypothetical protein
VTEPVLTGWSVRKVHASKPLFIHADHAPDTIFGTAFPPKLVAIGNTNKSKAAAESDAIARVLGRPLHEALSEDTADVFN